MQELTLIFMLGTVFLYVASVLTRRYGNYNEMNYLTIILGICSISAILLDDTVNGDMLGLMTLFPIVFILLQSIIRMIWRR